METGEGLTGIRILPRCPRVLGGVVLGQILGPSTALGEACQVAKLCPFCCDECDAWRCEPARVGDIIFTSRDGGGGRIGGRRIRDRCCLRRCRKKKIRRACFRLLGVPHRIYCKNHPCKSTERRTILQFSKAFFDSGISKRFSSCFCYEMPFVKSR